MHLKTSGRNSSSLGTIPLIKKRSYTLAWNGQILNISILSFGNIEFFTDLQSRNYLTTLFKTQVINPVFKTFNPILTPLNLNPNSTRTRAYHNEQKFVSSCKLCKTSQAHPLKICQKFKAVQVQERINFVRDNNLLKKNKKLFKPTTQVVKKKYYSQQPLS